jgi:hypothetical protein
MRRILLLLCAIALSLPAAKLFAGGDGSGDETLRRSDDAQGSYPGGPVTKSPLATGYYITDNDAPLSGSPWTPSYTFVDTTGALASSWRRILSGSKQRDSTTWKAAGSLGYEYFRNPNDAGDTTNNAFAGPISIGFPFYYYGKKYDSFYVSTNGLVALTNRRYVYDEAGNRIGYEPQRDDPRAVNPSGAAADTTPDDYGYKVVALGSTSATSAYSTSKTTGMLNPNNTALPNSGEKSILAPLWTNAELSQFDATTGLPDDFGRVYWRRDPSGNRLVIYYVNMSMIGLKNIPIINQQQTVGRRQIRANFQVVLDRSDSTVQFNYVSFPGEYRDQQQQVIRVPSNAMYRANATIGIQSHDQEYTNYLYNAGFQGNVYAGGPGANPATTPHPALAIQFKQWKNIVRVISVSFQVPKRNDTGYVDLPKGVLANNYELLLGNAILGVVRPVGIVQNVSSDVGPVNITQQPIQFNVVFRIRDLVNVNAAPVYQKTATTRQLYPIYQETTTRHSKDTIVFDPYVTNASLLKELGRFKAEVISSDRGPLGVSYGQQWPFDDTTGIRLFGISRQELPYINTFDDYDNSPEDGIIPSVKRWVSIGAQVVDGDLATYNPPPPRGPQGILSYSSPVVKLDRRDNGGAFYNLDQVGVKGGDTLISFPINLSTVQSRPVLVLSYERSGKNTYPRGWSDNIRFGPEHATYNTLKTAYITGATPDMMMVEFAEPSPNGIDNITNVQNWRDPNFNDNSGVIKWPGSGSPRWGVFGGGGGSFDPSKNAIDTTGKVIVDEFDAGKDFDFQRAYIPIPVRWTGNVNANKTFRFRIRVEAKSDKNPVGPPADDEDPFYVDNVMVVEPDKPEVEVTSVGYDWPYTEAPASQARAIPLYARVSNNGSTAATAFGVSLYVVNQTTPPPTGRFSYYRYVTILSLGAGQTMRQNFPEWNAQECGAAITPGPNTPATVTTTYRIFGQILPQGYDSYAANDLTYTDFNLTLGPSFAYDDAQNDVPQFSSLSGKGLNLVPATNQDGNGAQPYGPDGGSTSGSFAMQFRILTRDTVRGFKAFYGAANQSPDLVLYQLYKQPANASLSQPPSVNGAIKSTRRYARRGEGTPDYPTGNQFSFDQYVTFTIDTPYVIDPGIYFATVSQLGQTGLELGGDASRMGQVTTIRSDGPPLGIGNYSVPAYPEFNPAKGGADRFWYEVTAESGGWNPMLTTVGNPGYPHLTWIGQGAIPTYTRGSWIPMIRPYFGAKASGACTVEPVELATFNVTSLATALRLDWTTASEMNNHGFYVERRVKGEGENAWNKDLTFVPGAGTSNQVREYSFTDDKVVANTTYQYRLRQEDRDGSVHYSDIKEGRINSASTGAAVNSLSQNTPNPFSQSTQIDFSVAESGTVNLEIVDIYGKVVRGFTVDAKAGSGNSLTWDGRDAAGDLVPNGVYVYKLSGNGFTLSHKLTVTR